jgi:hypothetical protein
MHGVQSFQEPCSCIMWNAWLPPYIRSRANSCMCRDLSEKGLVGPMPAPALLPSSLVELILGFNQITGSIVGDWGALSSLQNLQLTRNKLSAFRPSSLPGSLQLLALTSNELEGSIPTTDVLPEGLEYLWLENNRLTGGISGTLPAKLQHFIVSNNLLTTDLQSLARALPRSLKILQLDNTSLSGQLPSNLVLPPALAELDLSNNFLSGDSCIARLLELPNKAALKLLCIVLWSGVKS